MVGYKVTQVLLFDIVVRPLVDPGSDNSFYRTERNLRKMIKEGRRCRVVSPLKVLSKSEIEEYRKYFCKKAKTDMVNYIYFTIPVSISRRVDEKM